MNKNRQVFITRDGVVSPNNSWGKNISNILGSVGSSSDPTIFEGVLGNLSDWDVHPNVFLTYNEGGIPVPTSKNNTRQPLKDLLSNSSKLNKALGAANVASAAISAFTGGGDDIDTALTFNTYLKNVPAYNADSPTPISFEYSFDFKMGMFGLWNALEEVVKPLLNLYAPVAIQRMNAWSIAGPFPNATELGLRVMRSFVSKLGGTRRTNENGEEINSDSDANLVTSMLSTIGNALEDIVMDAYRAYTYTVKFGSFEVFPDMLITNCKNFTLSHEVDQYGYPISGSITLQFDGIKPIALRAHRTEALAVRFGTQANNGGM